MTDPGGQSEDTNAGAPNGAGDGFAFCCGQSQTPAHSKAPGA